MAKTKAEDVAKSIQESLGLENTPTGQQVAHSMYLASSENFRASVGDPLETNSLDFMNGLLEYPETLATEWVTLATRIGRVIAHKNILSNKLAPFKMTNMPLGYTMEEFFVEAAKEHGYNQQEAETNLFKRELPDIKTAFYIVNRKSYYKATVTDDDLRSYFVTWDGVNSLIARIVDSLYNGDNRDDYNYMKSALTTHYENGYMKIINLDAPVTDTATAKDLARQLTMYASILTEPHNEYNAMSVTKQNELDDLYIILTAESNSYLNIDWLSQTFQLDVANFKTHVLVIPTLPDTTNGKVEAMLVDREIYKVFDQKYNVNTQYNGEGLYWNYWLHHWEAIATSRFANAIAFVSGSATNKVTGITIEPEAIAIKKDETKKVKMSIQKTGIDASVSVTATPSDEQITATINDDYTEVTISATSSATAGLKTVEVKDTVANVSAIIQVVVTE